MGGLEEGLVGGVRAGAWLFPALVALAGVAAAGDPPGPGSERVVGVLLGVLLCLALGLALAWRHLCRLSPGRYHPRPMGRRALGALRGRWQWLRGRGDAEEPPCQRDGEGGAAVGGGSAEALLSDLHAFSGTAAWGDTRPHVTAL
ncbi:protein tyrosine phosphatase receptor type C-associated protein [Pterocles gutturalis]